MARDLNTAFQRVLSGQDGPQVLTDQLRQAANQLQLLLEQGGQ